MMRMSENLHKEKVSKTCVIFFDQQRPPKLVAKKMRKRESHPHLMSANAHASPGVSKLIHWFPTTSRPRHISWKLSTRPSCEQISYASWTIMCDWTTEKEEKKVPFWKVLNKLSSDMHWWRTSKQLFDCSTKPVQTVSLTLMQYHDLRNASQVYSSSNCSVCIHFRDL